MKLPSKRLSPDELREWNAKVAAMTPKTPARAPVRKMTHAELAAAQERKDWPLLWPQVMPLVRLTIGRMLADKDRAEGAADDMVQEGMLVAAEAMQHWTPMECALSTYVTNRVRWYVMHALAEQHNGGIGSYKQEPVVLSLGDERPGATQANEEEENADDDGTFEAALTYAGFVMLGGQYDGDGYVPDGFGDPSEEADCKAEEALRAALQHLTAAELELVSTVYGLGGGSTQTVTDYAAARGIPLRTAEWRMAKAKAKLAGLLRNFSHS